MVNGEGSAAAGYQLPFLHLGLLVFAKALLQTEGGKTEEGGSS